MEVGMEFHVAGELYSAADNNEFNNSKCGTITV